MKLLFSVSLKSQLTAIFVLFQLLPTLLFGYIGYRYVYEHIKTASIRAVGQAADTRRDQLQFMLTGAHGRALRFASNINHHCSMESESTVESCLRNALQVFVENEFAQGAYLRRTAGGGDISVGDAAVRIVGVAPLQPGQLAGISAPLSGDNRVYYIAVDGANNGYQLIVTYPIKLIADLFMPSLDLGQSGEIFLADNAGFFVTQAKYPSVQGVTSPITVDPMRQCLAMDDGEALDMDYRNVAVIHGFRHIPWLGGGCIMAHIDQAEAFAVLEKLRWHLFSAVLLLSALAIMISVRFSRNIIRPVHDLLHVTHRVIDGDYAASAVVLGDNEISELSRSFNVMIQRLRMAFDASNTSQERLEHLVQERTSLLAEAHNLLRTIIDTSPIRVFWKDKASRYLGCNTAFAKDAGMSNPDDLIGKDDFQLVWKAQAEAYRADDRVVMDTGTPKLSYDEVSTSPEGRQRWLCTSKVPLRHIETGEIFGVLGLYEDVTEDKAVERCLERSAELLRHMGKLAKVGAWELNIPTMALYWSEEVYLIHEVDPAIQPTLEQAIAFYAPEAQPVIRQAVQAAIAEGTPWDLELPLVTAKGTPLWVRAQGSAVYQNGQRVALVGASQDITRQKQIEFDMIKATQVAGVANRAKSEFLANMSHEIRTPLNAILGLIYLVLDTPLLPQQRDYLKKVYSSSKALLNILNDILDYSKIEANRLEIEHLPMRIETLLKNVADLFGMQIESKGLELFLDISPNVPVEVLGDGLRLTQVLNNLVSNAVKFTEQGEIAISVDVCPSTMEGHPRAGLGWPDCPVRRTGGECGNSLAAARDTADPVGSAQPTTVTESVAGADTAAEECGRRLGSFMTLCFAVRDTGIGLSKNQADHLFQPFAQANGTITRKHGGTGLGLAISRKLVELMGGQITVASVEGQGSTFSFSITVGLAQTAIARRDAKQLEHLKVLVVDDFGSARLYLKRLLENWRLTVDTAASGAEALTCIEAAQRGQHPFDVVLLDWYMPPMHGLDVARRIEDDVLAKRLDPPPSVIMVTAYQEEETLARAGAMHFDGVLVKPIMPSALYDILIAVRNLRRSGQVGRLGKINLSETLHFDGAHILLVEDNTINQEVAASILKKHGLVVTIADHGGKAVELVQHRHFDAVLMDLHMPVMDGFEAAARIRELPQGQQLPIIAMTAAVMQEDQERCHAIGMVDFIAKPIDPDHLVKILKKWLPAAYLSVQPVSSREPAPETEAAVAAGLPYNLPGFDVPMALRRLGGDTHLLTRLLLSFAGEQAGVPAQLDALLAEGDTVQAIAVLHTLKGVANNLGATTLAQVAGQLEQEIKAGGPRPSHPAFTAIVETALSAIHRYVRPVVAIGGDVIDQPAVKQLLADLTPFLQQRKLIPDELMQALQRLTQTDLPGAPLGQLLHQIDQIDYDGALLSIALIMAAL